SKKVGYVYMKATQGTTYKDPKFAQFWAAAGSLPSNEKIPRGAYHFLSSTSDPILQAESFVAYVNLHGGLQKNDLPPAMDFEWDVAPNGSDQWAKIPTSTIVNRAVALLIRVEQLTGRIPMLYTSKAWWHERGIPESDMKTSFARYPLWVADYSKSAHQSET